MGRRPCRKSRPRITAAGVSGVRFSSGLVRQIEEKLGYIPDRFDVELYEDRIVFRPSKDGKVKTWKRPEYEDSHQLVLYVGARVVRYALEIGCSIRSFEVLDDGSVVWYGQEVRQLTKG